MDTAEASTVENEKLDEARKAADSLRQVVAAEGEIDKSKLMGVLESLMAALQVSKDRPSDRAAASKGPAGAGARRGRSSSNSRSPRRGATQ
eukprot:10075523-Alexandrium_andersonii.AAC.1